MDPAPQMPAGPLRVPRQARFSIDRVLELARGEIGPAVVGSVLPFALVLYLALRGGGYDRVVYSEVGMVVWWLLVLGALVGLLPVVRIPRGGWIALGLLSAFVGWTALGAAWSESAERSIAEAGRVAAYLGVFALALAAQGRGALRRTVNAVAAAIALVGLLALLSRLHPEWFPTNDAPRLLPGDIGDRLRYPLNYWNGLAALMAMGIPLVLGVALHARHLVTRALAAAALPAMALTAFYTYSRGGAVAIGFALLAFLVLYPRLSTLPTLAVTGAGAALLISAATQRNALEDDILADAARAQGDEMLAVVLVVCAGVGLVQVAIGLAGRHGLGPKPRITRRRGAAIAGGLAAVLAVVALAVGLPSEMGSSGESDGSVGAAAGSERFESFATESRSRYWGSALDATATAPLAGIGPGTFEFWWARQGEGSFARDAHSLFLETLAESGIIGLVLVASVVGMVLGVGVRRALKCPLDARGTLAAAVASCGGFTVAAALDWVWELPVLPVAFFLLAAAILGPAPVPRMAIAGRSSEGPRGGVRLRERVGLLAIAILALVAIAVPYLNTTFVRESQSQLRSGERDPALRSADAARTLEPFAATASAQRALVLAESGSLARAVDSAREATRDEPTNYRTWLLLASLEAERGRAAEAIRAYERAFEQSPRSVAFTEVSPDEFGSRLEE